MIEKDNGTNSRASRWENTWTRVFSPWRRWSQRNSEYMIIYNYVFTKWWSLFNNFRYLQVLCTFAMLWTKKLNWRWLSLFVARYVSEKFAAHVFGDPNAAATTQDTEVLPKQRRDLDTCNASSKNYVNCTALRSQPREGCPSAAPEQRFAKQREMRMLPLFVERSKRTGWSSASNPETLMRSWRIRLVYLWIHSQPSSHRCIVALLFFNIRACSLPRSNVDGSILGLIKENVLSTK